QASRFFFSSSRLFLATSRRAARCASIPWSPSVTNEKPLRFVPPPCLPRGKSVWYTRLPRLRHEQTFRSGPGHAGHAVAENPRARTAQRFRRQRASQTNLRGRVAGQRRLTLSRSAQIGAGGLDFRRVENNGEQSPREILFAHTLGTAASRKRIRELEPALNGNFARGQAQGGLKHREHTRRRTCGPNIGFTRFHSGCVRCFAGIRLIRNSIRNCAITSKRKPPKTSRKECHRKRRVARRCWKWAASKSAKKNAATRAK